MRGTNGATAEEIYARKDQLAKHLHTTPENVTTEALAAFEAPQEIVVEGYDQLVIFYMKGLAPESASLSLSIGKIRLEEGSAFRKGSVIWGEFLAVVTEVAQVDELDKETRQPVRTEQRHKATVLDLMVRERA